MHADGRDDWLDDVKRWFYGGTPPAGDQQDSAHGASFTTRGAAPGTATRHGVAETPSTAPAPSRA